MTERMCRGCGVWLTTAIARTYQGRWVGACRQCESAEGVERQRRRRTRAKAS